MISILDRGEKDFSEVTIARSVGIAVDAGAIKGSHMFKVYFVFRSPCRADCTAPRYYVKD